MALVVLCNDWGMQFGFNEFFFTYFSAPEPLILDYVTQQHKLFPQIATAYAMWVTAAMLRKMHDEIIAEVNRGDYKRLIEVSRA